MGARRIDIIERYVTASGIAMAIWATVALINATFVEPFLHHPRPSRIWYPVVADAAIGAHWGLHVVCRLLLAVTLALYVTRKSNRESRGAMRRQVPIGPLPFHRRDLAYCYLRLVPSSLRSDMLTDVVPAGRTTSQYVVRRTEC